MDKIFFIGKFPPPYGGSTIKNDILYSVLSRHFSISKFDSSQLDGNIIKLLVYIRLLVFLMINRSRKGIICIASFSLFKLTKVIWLLRKSMLKNISVFAVGGAIHKHIENSSQDLSMLKEYKNIYVETASVKHGLKELGFHNVGVIPNCRLRPQDRKLYTPESVEGIRCVFLSRICLEKGVEILVEAAERLNKAEIKYSIDFYGPIENDVKDAFDRSIQANANLHYMGIFRSNKKDVYELLMKYDILLFPTQAENEGMPGVLVEAKIAGIPVISSSWKNNEDLINDRVDGIILRNNASEDLSNAIIELAENRELIKKLRVNSYDSAEKYFIDNYVEAIIHKL